MSVIGSSFADPQSLPYGTVSASRGGIDVTLCQCRQFSIRLAPFFKDHLQLLEVFVEAELFGPSRKRAVDRDLVMFDPLPRGNQTDIAQRRIFYHARPFFYFVDQRRHGLIPVLL
jgi:hypothetical protein